MDQPAENVSGLHEPADNSRWLSDKGFWFVVIIAVVGLKMLLTGRDGIFSIKADSRNYAQAASHIFLNNYLSVMPTHRPGLPVIASIVSQFGIPFKLYLEFLLCFNATIAGMLAGQLMRSRWAGASLMAILVLNPWFMEDSQLFMTEPLVGALILMQLVFGAKMIVHPVGEWKIWWAVFAGSASMLHVLARNETILVVLYWTAVLIVVGIRQRKTFFSRQLFQSTGNVRIVLLAIPFAMMMAGLSACKHWNHYKFGIAAICVTEAKGFTRLMNALYSIPPEEKIRYAPVTRQSLALACDHSPTLAKYRDRLLDVRASAYQTGKRKLRLEEQFGTWLNWHVFDSIPEGAAAAVVRRMHKAAVEIREAQDGGDLPHRSAKFPISPYTDFWVGDVHRNFIDAMAYSMCDQSLSIDVRLKGMRNGNAFDELMFDESLLRRNGLSNNSTISISGMLRLGNSEATEVVVCNEQGDLIASTFIEFKETSNGCFFNCYIDQIENPNIDQPIFVYLRRPFQTGSVKTNKVELELRRFQKVDFKFDVGEGEDAAPENWILQSHRQLGNGFRKGLKDKLFASYHWLLIGCCATVFFAGVFFRGSRSQYFDVVWLAIAAIVFVAVRCLMYSLIEAWLGWGVQRYVEPNVLAYIFGIACTAFVIGGAVQALFVRCSSGDGRRFKSRMLRKKLEKQI